MDRPPPELTSLTALAAQHPKRTAENAHAENANAGAISSPP
jgi:hypothetical protein